MNGFSERQAGSVVEPCKANTTQEWLEIELLGDDGLPVPFVQYRVVLPDAQMVTGYLDETGFARLEGIEAGTCQVSFPELDGSEWDFIETAGSKLAQV